MHSILRAYCVSKRFATKVILDSVSFQLERQKIYALMGANGSGKTTLFNTLSGFLTADSGEISFKGRNIGRLQPYQISRLGIGRTFQDLRLVSGLTVRENILLSMTENPTDYWLRGLLPQSWSKQSNKMLNDKVETILEEYCLDTVSSRLAGEVSYGQQKLLTTACCVANGAELLLLDEPVASISPAHVQTIATMLKRIRTEGKTILLIEHNSEFIQDVADQILFLNEAKLRLFDNYHLLKSDPSVLESYR